MRELNEKIREELDGLVNIATRFGDGMISESLFRDVLQPFKRDPDALYDAKEYLLAHNVTVISERSDVEEMDDTLDADDASVIKPYDPSRIDISPKNLALSNLISRIENNEINLMPDFQRRAGLWNTTQKSQLIESLILRIPLPAFYFDGTDNDEWIVIDGLQRLTVLKEFFCDKTLILKGMEFLRDLENVNYDSMPKVYIRRMLETQVVCYIISPGAPVNLKYNIFKRINTGGLGLEPQEIRHALFQGFSTSYLKELAETKEFVEVTGYSVPNERMLDREFVLRFISFYEFGVEKYSGSIDEFLNEGMEYINKDYARDPDYAKYVKARFILSLNICGRIFGKFAFRRMPDESRRRSISKALFETWTSLIAKLPDEKTSLLIERNVIIRERYMPMFTEDEEFYRSIGSGKIAAVRKRFEKINSLIQEVLQND